MDFLKDIIKETGNEYASLVSDGASGDVTDFIDTGSYIFNALLGGGINKGLISGPLISQSFITPNNFGLLVTGNQLRLLGTTGTNVTSTDPAGIGRCHSCFSCSWAWCAWKQFPSIDWCTT